MKHRILSLATLLSSFSFTLAPLALAPLVISCSSGDLKDSDSAEAAFKEAEEFDKDERYEEAVTKYSEVKNKFPYSKLATEAELRIADVNYKKEAYIEAATSYQLFKDFHPRHSRIDYATFRLGMSYYNQLDTVDRDLSPATKAIQAFDEVITSYSTSQHLAEAKEKKAKSIQMLSDKEAYIANFYFIRDHFEAALKRYNALLAKYAGTGHDEEALYRAGFSAFEMNDASQAQEKLKTLIEKYPNSNFKSRASSLLEKYGSR